MMIKNIFFYTSLVVSVVAVQAQELPNRYAEEIFDTVQISEDIPFSTNIPTVSTTNLFGNLIANEESYGNVTVTLDMDIYQPVGDDYAARPVMIFAFGGGFVNGNRNEARIRALANTFAKRGFVTATIDYRLGMNLNNPELSKRAVYRATQDGRSAVRYFRKNAAALGINPEQIYLSGHSAGALVAYHNVYLDKDSERPASTRAYFGRPDLGGLDEIGDNKFYGDGSPVSGKANGTVGYAGAVGDLSYIENDSDAPSAYFHSTDDNTVPYGTAVPFSQLNWIPGINLPLVHGSGVMSTRANQVGASNTLYSYTNRGHGVHGSGSTLFPDIAPRSSQYLVDEFLGPVSTAIIGSTEYCTSCSEQTYTLSDDSEFYYDWQITGGTFIERDPFSNEVIILWDNNAVNRNLKVTPYSQYLARGRSYDLFAGPATCAWDLQPGLGNDIGAGSDEVYVIGTNQRIYRWVNNNWSMLPTGAAKRIDVAANGMPWVVGTNNGIYRYENGSWRRTRGSARDIGANGSQVYVSGTNNVTYRLRSNGRWQGATGGRSIRLDVDSNGDAWVVGEDNYVYIVRDDVYLPRRGDFKATDITVAAGTDTVWALELGTGVPHRYLGGGDWEAFNGVLTQVTANDDGTLWGVNEGLNIWSNDCFVAQENAAFSQEDLAAKVLLYPNPSSDLIHVITDAFKSDAIRATVVNIYGTEVLSNDLEKSGRESSALNISSLIPGHYILRLESQGDDPVFKRFIVR